MNHKISFQPLAKAGECKLIIKIMPLLNYTTKISVEKTLGEIQRMLVLNGAKSVLSEYDDNGYIIALSFIINVNDQSMAIRLPSDWRPVLKIMEDDRKTPNSFCNQEQALRVAWRIIKDWVEAQMAILQTKMVKIEQIFLPYIITNNNQTIFEKFEENKQKLLN